MVESGYRLSTTGPPLQNKEEVRVFDRKSGFEAEEGEKARRLQPAAINGSIGFVRIQNSKEPTTQGGIVKLTKG